MSSLYGVGVWPAACNRLLHGRRSHTGNASSDGIRKGASGDWRRPEARSGRPTDAVEGQRFGDGGSHASSPRVASSRDRTIRCCPRGHELYARYRRRWRRAGTSVTDSFHGQPASRGGDDSLEQCRSGGRGYAARRVGFYPEALGESGPSKKIAEPTVVDKGKAPGVKAS